MKQVLIALVLLSGSAAIACPTGHWSGRASSAIPSIDRKPISLEVSQERDLCLLRFECPDAGMKELWELKENHLTQKEMDGKGKVTENYGATLEVRNGVEGYYLNCTGDKGCDAGGDPRTFWRIDDRFGRISYEMWGIDPEKASHRKAKAMKRIDYAFRKVK